MEIFSDIVEISQNSFRFCTVGRIKNKTRNHRLILGTSSVPPKESCKTQLIISQICFHVFHQFIQLFRFGRFTGICYKVALEISQVLYKLFQLHLKGVLRKLAENFAVFFSNVFRRLQKKYFQKTEESQLLYQYKILCRSSQLSVGILHEFLKKKDLF